MYDNCDEDRNEYFILDNLVDYTQNKNVSSLKYQNIFVKVRASLCRSNMGQQIFCQWKDGQTFWEKLSDIKQSHPVQTE